MRWKRWLALLVFIDFAAFTGYVLYELGIDGFMAGATANLGAIQVLLDLCIALVLAFAWLVPDARRRGVSPWPWLVGALFAGSLSPLLYLVVRPQVKEQAATPVAVG